MSDLEAWIRETLKAKRKGGAREHVHTTRMMPKRSVRSARRRIALLGHSRRDLLPAALARDSPRGGSRRRRPLRFRARACGRRWSSRGRSAPFRAGAISPRRTLRATSIAPPRARATCRKRCAASCVNSVSCKSASGRVSELGRDRRKPTSHADIVDEARLAEPGGDEKPDRPVGAAVDRRKRLGVARGKIIDDEARALELGRPVRRSPPRSACRPQSASHIRVRRGAGSERRARSSAER